jgi:hypothetical protein
MFENTEVFQIMENCLAVTSTWMSEVIKKVTLQYAKADFTGKSNRFFTGHDVDEF